MFDGLINNVRMAKPWDIVDILIVAFLFYKLMRFLRNTNAQKLFQGLVLLAAATLLAEIMHLKAFGFIMRTVMEVGILALVIIFQPELRKALEQLGNKSLLSSVFLFENACEKGERFSDRTISEIVRAVNEMSEVRTGALIVLEQNILLTEYIDTGIMLDAEVSSQLLINIFEHNTPLHDGAVILRGDRITAATCYLPLSDNAKISKKYGTRHRAGLGISEASDSFTIIVSEETGRVSCAYMGVLTTGVTASGLREQLHQMQKRTLRMRDARIPRFRKGWKKDET